MGRRINLHVLRAWGAGTDTFQDGNHFSPQIHTWSSLSLAKLRGSWHCSGDKQSQGTVLSEWVLQVCVLWNNENNVMVQKRDRTKTDSSGVLAVLLGTDLKFYVFMSKRKGQYLHACVPLPISFFLLYSQHNISRAARGAHQWNINTNTCKELMEMFMLT